MPRGRKPKTCRECGCTDADCRQCVERTGEPCYWVEPDLCSACANEEDARLIAEMEAEDAPIGVTRRNGESWQ